MWPGRDLPLNGRMLIDLALTVRSHHFRRALGVRARKHFDWMFTLTI